MRRDGEMSAGSGTKCCRPRTLDAQLACLEALDAEGLMATWEQSHGSPPPSALPPRIFLLALAHDLQAGVLGGLTPALERRLARIKIKPGATLLRDWGGRTWRVEVNADGSFEWDGQRWRSLSAIAREITGTSRNGPAFFGLRGGTSHGAA
jgi:hypothetical protein